MKFFLIAAVALLALAQGSFAQDAADLDKLTQYFENLKNKMTEDVTAFLNNHDVASQAQTFMQERKTQLEPLATQIQEQLSAAATKFQEHMTPLAANIQPMVANLQQQMEALVQKLTEKARSIEN